jgi:hypothetical protein
MPGERLFVGIVGWHPSRAVPTAPTAPCARLPFFAARAHGNGANIPIRTA